MGMTICRDAVYGVSIFIQPGRPQGIAPTGGFPKQLRIMNYHNTHVRASLRDFGHRNPTLTSLESATLDFVNIGPLDLPTHAEPTRRVVDPLSLATLADSIMIEVARPKSLWCRFK